MMSVMASASSFQIELLLSGVYIKGFGTILKRNVHCFQKKPLNFLLSEVEPLYTNSWRVHAVDSLLIAKRVAHINHDCIISSML